jgi:hypothetical protein
MAVLLETLVIVSPALEAAVVARTKEKARIIYACTRDSKSHTFLPSFLTSPLLADLHQKFIKVSSTGAESSSDNKMENFVKLISVENLPNGFY